MNSTIFMLLFGIIMGLILAIVPFIFWKKKTGSKIWPYFCGMVIFFGFVEILEAILHQFVLLGSLGEVIQSNVLFYGLYGGFAAGIFEETGRLFAFKCILKKENEMKNAVSYGLGHGGIEIFLILVLTYFTYIPFALGLTTGTEADSIIHAALGSFTWPLVSMAALERVSALCIHLALSILMFIAVKKRKMWLYPVSIVLHAAIDFFACLYQFGFIGIYTLEGLTLLYALIILFIAISAYKKYRALEVSEETLEENETI